MFKKLLSLRFRQALLAGFGALLVLLVIATVAGLLRIEAINRHTQEIIHDQRIRTGLVSSMMHVVSERAQIINTLISADDSLVRVAAYQRYQALARDFSDGLQQLRNTQAAAGGAIGARAGAGLRGADQDRARRNRRAADGSTRYRKPHSC